MYELIPILGGVAAGFIAAAAFRRETRPLFIAVAAVVLGVGAAVLSGEAAENWLFVIWDTAQAAVVAVLALVLALRMGWFRGTARD